MELCTMVYNSKSRAQWCTNAPIFLCDGVQMPLREHSALLIFLREHLLSVFSANHQIEKLSRHPEFFKNIVSLVHQGVHRASVVYIAARWCTRPPYTIQMVTRVPP